MTLGVMVVVVVVTVVMLVVKESHYIVVVGSFQIPHRRRYERIGSGTACLKIAACH